jgi:hypothetical protein
MKLTAKNKEVFVRNKLATDTNWALKALVRIYVENQTSAEKAAQGTIEKNDVGFSGADGEFLSSLAEQARLKGKLSDGQMKCVFKLMPKYWRQVIKMADQEKLEKMVESA